MFDFKIENGIFSTLLGTVSNAIDRKATLPILSNVLIKVENGVMSVTGSDLEREMVMKHEFPDIQDFEITLPANKLNQICKALPAEQMLRLRTVDGDQVKMTAGRSNFTLKTLPATDYPNIEQWQGSAQFKISQRELLSLLKEASYSMANQDVRYYLNGLSLEITPDKLTVVATDGHRLALSERQVNLNIDSPLSIILPRTAVLDFERLLSDSDDEVEVILGSNHCRLILGDLIATTKLVDGRFPDYRRVMPKGNDKDVIVNREELKNALSRASILSNEKFRGVRLTFKTNELHITANNPEQEQAEEIIDLEYNYPELEIGFNIGYLLDVLGNYQTENVHLSLNDANTSMVMYPQGNENVLAIAMPMRL